MWKRKRTHDQSPEEEKLRLDFELDDIVTQNKRKKSFQVGSCDVYDRLFRAKSDLRNLLIEKKENSDNVFKRLWSPKYTKRGKDDPIARKLSFPKHNEEGRCDYDAYPHWLDQEMCLPSSINPSIFDISTSKEEDPEMSFGHQRHSSPMARAEDDGSSNNWRNNRYRRGPGFDHQRRSSSTFRDEYEESSGNWRNSRGPSRPPRGRGRPSSRDRRRGAQSFDSLNTDRPFTDGRSSLQKERYSRLRGERDMECDQSASPQRYFRGDTNIGKFHSDSRRGRGASHRKERQHPMGYKDMERLLKMPSEAIALELLREHSGYHLLLKDETISDDKFFLLVKVLSLASESKSSKESLYEVFNLTCDSRFMDKLCAFSLSVKRNFLNQAKIYFTNLLTFLNSYSNAMTSNAIDKVPNVVDACLATLIQLQREAFVSQELIDKYEALQEMLKTATCQWKQDKQLGPEGRRRRREEMDDMEPPDDFTQMSVLPTPRDLVKIERPFLRKNIVEGKYKDERHYLDVQFRLLREDFIKPLRNGICDFRSDTKSRFQDIRIYRNVRIVGARFVHRRMMHLVELNLPKHVKSIENSKRLLFGNLLCFSSDNFKTLIFGSVAERDAELFRKEGVIGVQFETDLDNVSFSYKYVMAESRAYFMAYKHVLRSLQDMAHNGVAMTPYIVHVNPDVSPPQYLGHSIKYDLRVMEDMKLMNKLAAQSRLFNFEDETHEPDENLMPTLREVFVMRDLITWPSEEDLGLDSSQRRALRSALTRELAIIQGPPGTGKTFIGLKITQILLHNLKVWNNEDHPRPILVVCFTNHALDQFLEGMTPYTNSIVRVGSRTKSEKINRFQVNNLIRSLHSRRQIPSAMHEMNIGLRHEVLNLEHDIKFLRATVDECRKPAGIFALHVFSKHDIIPQHFYQQLSQVGLGHWLLLNVSPESVNKFEATRRNQTGRFSQTSRSVNTNARHRTENNIQEDSDDDEFNDAEEYLHQEEQDRHLEDDCDEEETYRAFNIDFEVTDEMLAKDMSLADAAFRMDENNFEAAMTYNIISGQREALQIGCEFEMNEDLATKLEKNPRLNLMKLDFPNRWNLYKFWIKRLEEKLLKQLVKVEANYQRNFSRMNELKNQEYLYLMRHASVVGMTTTGAAQYSSIMQDLSPSIVIIEEAAEILESHVITSLTSKCQHLIMIGDHQQLRPSATVYELATKYGLETSLFERMIKNGLAYETLEYQHRMRPSISRLLVPSIYPSLKDHDSVHKYPKIRGIVSDVFFVNHDIPEKAESDDNSSHENQHEAEFIIGLCKHLMLQGYAPEDVTILTPYSGQFFLLKKIQRQHVVCQGVRICVVDNFQGEENKIILLSLVRSNDEGKVGFLRTDNRICVALSRAKHGLYVTGNMDLLCASSELWKKIKCDLMADNSFGKSLMLKCENHPDELITITKGIEFQAKAPEGGCLRSCNRNLPHCAHACPKLCHMDDPKHLNYKCRMPCPKILCSLDHPCPEECHQDCPPCKVLVEKAFSCGHKNVIQCHVDPINFRCPHIVEKTLDHCQHSVKMPCHDDPKTFPCPFACDTRLDCGHQCRLKCHRNRDPDHLNYDCKQPCTMLNSGCSQDHLCSKLCYEECGNCIVKVQKILPCGHQINNVECSASPDSLECKKKCKKTLPCNHACKKLCYQTCGNCPVKIKKNVPECNHEITIECCTVPTIDLCEGKCTKKLPCNHACLEKCKDICTKECKELVPSTVTCPRNHPVKVPCYLLNKIKEEDVWRYCDSPCQKQLNCSHKCKGQCGNCFHGRVHMSCSEPCNRVLVCGHTCKFPCGEDCPPCQELCNWKCEHSRCRKKCGNPCIPCKELCRWKCEHRECKDKCGNICSIDPCNKPCKKKLKCDHPCIGFCGDPCPPLCRICDKEELTEFILFGFEEDDDSRFVFLQDCGHSIEAQGLEGWLEQDNNEIGMKTCPRCRQSIYNNRRYQKIILETYKDVAKVKSKYFTSKLKIKTKDIELLLQDPEIYSQFSSEVQQIMKSIGFNPKASRKPRKQQKFCSDAELKLYLFQAQVLKKASEVLLIGERRTYGLRGSIAYASRNPESSKHRNRLMPRVKELVKRVLEKNIIIAPQMEDEIGCELQRLMVLPAYWNFKQKLETFSNNPNLQTINVKLDQLIDPTIKFDDDTDVKLRALLKESEQYVGGLGITESERVMIIKAMGLRQGHWYKCPNGHVYCIGECGGATQEAKCPTCGSTIGGRNHALQAGNRVASEMDGARHAAWSDHANNMANFQLND